MAFLQAREGATPSVARSRQTTVLAVPMAEARALPPGALALGVFPPSRSAETFLVEMGYTSAPRTPGRSKLPDALMALLTAQESSVAVWVEDGAHVEPAASLALAFPGARAAVGPSDAAIADIAVIVARSRAVIRSVYDSTSDERLVVIGVGEKTPLWISAGRMPSLLGGGIARRTGIATPYDLAATIVLDSESPSATAGRSMRGVVRGDDPADWLDRFASRLEQTVRAEPTVVLTASILAVLLVVGAAFAAGRDATRVVSLFGAMGAAIPAGYTLALMVPVEPWARSVLILATVGLIAWRWPSARSAPTVLLVTAAGVATLTVIAALAPDSFVARGLWGDPLNSWRLYGLRNHLAAYVAGGFIVGAVQQRWSAGLVATLGISVGVVIGASTFGANFVGVATFAAGLALAIAVSVTGRVRVLPVLVSCMAGVAAIAVTLLFDSVAPISHGGRAVQLVESRGVSAVVQLLHERVLLNRAEIDALGIAGWVLFLGALMATAALFDLAWRAPALSAAVRGALAGGALAALLAYITEDSGFFTGATLALFPWVIYTLARSEPPPSLPLDPARGGVD